MKIATIIARLLLGVIFVVFGLNGFFHFLPMPPQTNPAAIQFFTAVGTTGYMNVVFALQILGGLLLLLNILPVLGLVILGPIVFNIVLFHLTMAPSGLPLALVVAVLSLILATDYRDHFRHLVRQPAK